MWVGTRLLRLWVVVGDLTASTPARLHIWEGDYCIYMGLRCTIHTCLYMTCILG